MQNSLTTFYIPYLGMLLKDLAYYEENMKYIEYGTLINFEKLEKVQFTIEEFFRFKNMDMGINMIPSQELDFFDKLEEIKENDLEELAKKLEPEFTLYENKQKIKRSTNIDLKYFADVNVQRPKMTDSARLSKTFKK